MFSLGDFFKCAQMWCMEVMPNACGPPDMQVHYGMVLPSGKRQAPPAGYLPWGGPIDEDCAVWLHLVNLFTGRDNRTTHEVCNPTAPVGHFGKSSTTYQVCLPERT